MTDVYDLHSIFDADHPQVAEYERLLEGRRVENGMKPSRAFPCPGRLFIESRVGDRLLLGCSDCQFSVSVPARERRSVDVDRWVESRREDENVF